MLERVAGISMRNEPLAWGARGTQSLEGGNEVCLRLELALCVRLKAPCRLRPGTTGGAHRARLQPVSGITRAPCSSSDHPLAIRLRPLKGRAALLRIEHGGRGPSGHGHR